MPMGKPSAMAQGTVIAGWPLTSKGAVRPIDFDLPTATAICEGHQFHSKRTLGMPIGRFECADNRIQVIEMIDTGREAAIYGLKIFCRMADFS